ncbi:unnamed protein product [Rhizophagus irregularis]|nr:unnamed protein product [Rhizophagus irregularis]
MLLPPYVNNFPSIFPKATITNFPSFYIITRIFLSTKKCRIEVTAETILLPSPSPDFAEIERYLALPCDENVEALLWWQAHSTEFPVLSLMAKDYTRQMTKNRQKNG